MIPKTNRVRVLNFSVLQEIEGSRSADDFAALLDAMEFGDTTGLSEPELREMCLLALQDRQPEEAAALVLRHDMGGRLRDGQIRNLSVEMLDDKLWEEYSDMALHERFFNAGSLLYSAFPRSFPRPDAVRVELEVVATDETAQAMFRQAGRESFIVRLLADGMDDRSVLRRLFEGPLNGESFPQADTIVWIVRTEAVDARTARIDVISSGYWLDALRETQAYDSAAFADDPL